MSIKDMFLIAKSYGDPVSNSLNRFKDYLSVENGINKNWQDALTFKDNVAAINALNAKNAYEDQLRLLKQKGEFTALQHQAANLYDPQTGQYRPEYRAAQLAAQDTYESGNPYARLANHNTHRTTALATADAIGAIDPAQAYNLRNQALGNVGINAKQASNGTLSVRNANGYTHTIADPNLAAMYGADPTKASLTSSGWQRDDQVSHRDFNEQLALNANEAILNRGNNEHSLRLQHELKNHTPTNGQPPIDPKQYIETQITIFRELLNQGQDWIEAANNAETYTKNLHANNLFGIGTINAAQSNNPNTQNVGSILSNHLPNKPTPTTPQTGQGQQATAATPPNQLGSSTFAGTRFGSYQLPPRAETRQAEIAQLNAYIAQMNEKYQQNAKIAPDSHLVRQQAQAIANAKQQLERTEKETDTQYFKRINPITAAWNNILYGQAQTPSQMVK